MNELALFAGAGGGILGTHLLGWRPIAAVEIEEFCQEIILRRQQDGVLPLFPIWDNVKTFDGRIFRGKVDCITAGFPCQPFSVAGKQRGVDDERNMWPETLRIIREVRPTFGLLENVPGLLGKHGYFGTILRQLAEIGYAVRWGCLSAAAIGANHKRERLWIAIADTECELGREQSRRWRRSNWQSAPVPRNDGAQESLAYTDESRFGEVERNLRARKSDFGGCGENVANAESELRGEERQLRSDEQKERTSGGSETLADTQSHRRESWGPIDAAQVAGGRELDRSGIKPRDLANTDGERLEEQRLFEGLHPGKPQIFEYRSTSGRWWESEPAVGRVAHGVAFRVDRLRALGNGQVPGVVRAAWELLNL